MPEETKLLPCPFCGKKGIKQFIKVRPEGVKCWVQCYNDSCPICPETDSFQSEQEAIEAWNKRA